MMALAVRERAISFGGKETGNEAFGREYKELKQQGCLALLMSRGQTGMFFCGVLKTGNANRPHKVSVGFVPNDDAAVVGVGAGKYGRTDFTLDKAGNVETIVANGLSIASRTQVTSFITQSFGETMHRFAGVFGARDASSGGWQVLNTFLTANSQTVPADKLPGLK
jgi:hypothetical protein